MRNLKKRLALVSALALSGAMLAGCGEAAAPATTTAAKAEETTAAAKADETTAADKADETTAAAADNGAAETEAAAPAASADEGKVLNIQVWNDEFINRVASHYPGYEKVDDTHGKIGDVEVVWTITPSNDNAYQNNLDSVLPSNADAAADSKVDIFLVEADYALKYVDADANVAMKLSDLGITDADLGDQYQYTKDVVTDANGDLRGASWQACSAGLIYNRDIAKEVIGSDDPAEVQKAVADWATYNDTAKKVADAGYLMTAGYADTFRVYSNNVSGPWVQNGKVVVDANIKQWAEDTKAQVDAGQTTASADLWGDEWAKGFYPAADTKGVFCYFGPAWFFNFCMHADDEASIGAKGGWGFTVGPQGHFWGGTWICAANGTDNPTLVKDIILKMTTDKGILKDIATQDSDCVNSKSVLADLSSSSDGNLALLGGQNPYAVLAEGAEKVDMSKLSIYDQGCNEEYQKAMKNYFSGAAASYDEALAQFYTAIKEKYPELTTD